MCGICGFINEEREPASQQTLADMCATMKHRGPDEQGLWTKNRVALGMRRLKIIDLETGSQPIFNEDRSIVVVFNGEIYNFRSLRNELQKAGHTFYTQTDTEVIVHAYEQWGIECLQHFNGMFGLALWDSRMEQMFIARDRLGKKPLYYYHLPGKYFAFGSELKSILAGNFLTNREPNLEAIHHYLTLQYIPDPMSAFRGVKKLPPATYLVWKKGKIEHKKYWDLEYVPKTTQSEEELSRELEQRLTRAVQVRLISDVPLGSFLSGGIDSSIITALMARLSNKPVKTFSIGFEEDAFSELPLARIVAEKYHTNHHEFILSYDKAMILPELIEFFDEPFADSSALPMYFLSKMTREFVTVALCGDGGDETYAGYQRYRLDKLARYYAMIPAPLRRYFLEQIFKLLPESTNVPIEKNWVVGLKRLRQVTSISEKASLIRWGSYFSDEMKRNMYTPEMLHLIEDNNTDEIFIESFNRAKAESLLDKTLYVDVNNYLPGDLLVKADRMTMANSVEGRSPFLDYEMVEFAAKLPENLKLRGAVHKYLLKKTFDSLLPDQLKKIGKLGFGIPVGEWFRTSLKDMAHDLLLSQVCIERGIFRKEAIENLLREHINRKVDHGKRIWTLVMLELWFKKYNDTPENSYSVPAMHSSEKLEPDST